MLLLSHQEIDKLLSSVVRRQPGAPVPANAVPLGGRGMPRGVLPGGGAGRGTGSAAAAAARLAAAGRGNGAGRGPPPPGSDRNPKLRWDQTNEEVEIVIRVDPSEFLLWWLWEKGSQQMYLAARNKVGVFKNCLHAIFFRSIAVAGGLGAPALFNVWGGTEQIHDLGTELLWRCARVAFCR